MNANPITVSIYLDARRAKENGLFPVKLRVFSNALKKAQLYPTVFDLTQKEFENSYLAVKPRSELKDLKKKLVLLESNALDVAEKIVPFNFDLFKKRMFAGQANRENVFYHYESMIKDLNSAEKIGNASNYDLSQKSLKAFLKQKHKKEQSAISFSEISKDWLNEYERYMIGMGRSRTTVSMYLRALRAIFNKAIFDKEIEKEVYPFGKNGYVIPSTKKVKKALDKKGLRGIHDAIAIKDEQIKARAFWFFSYLCSGINIKDIALLKWSDIEGDTLQYFRAKTINTSKKDLQLISVHLIEPALEVINTYGIKENQPSGYVFQIISDEMSAVEKHAKIKNFTRFINQNLKKLAKLNNLSTDISTYWARHSFATNSIRNGSTLERVMENLGHSDPKTTMNYLASFEEEDKKVFSHKLMEF